MRHISVIKREMENYFKKIIEVFTSSPQDEETVGIVHNWLDDRENEDRKNEALYSFWVGQKPEMGESEVDMALREVYGKIGGRADAPARSRMWKLFAASLKYAAVVAVAAVSAVTAWHFTKEKYENVAVVEEYTKAGERRTVILPDGTRVQANSSTLLAYPERFVGKNRIVYLQGEALFDVVKNDRQPFIVKSGTVSVTALGTEFNVTAYGEEDEVKATLLEGKVKVVCGGDGGESYILAPGEQVSYGKNTGVSSKSTVSTEDVTAWTDGIMVFRGATMDEILKVLHRKYGVSFDVDCDESSRQDKYSFRFRETASLDEVMEIMEMVSGNMEYRISGQMCRIRIKRH